MKDLVIETIGIYFGDLEGVTTEEFYKEYLDVCKKHNVEPEARQKVNSLAAYLTDTYSKRYCITKFARKDD